ncbi:aquaporin-11 [Ixodes scapularis]
MVLRVRAASAPIKLTAATPCHYGPHANQNRQVSTTKGALIEGIITCVSRFVAMRSIYWTQNVSTIINSITTVVLVLAALTTTGGYFNPIMASALMLGCGGSTLTEHFTVYWVGALIGGFFGRYFDFRLEIAIKEKYA